MPSEAKDFFTEGKAIAPKAVCFGYAYKMLKGLRRVESVFNSQYDKIYLTDDYHSFKTTKSNICLYR